MSLSLSEAKQRLLSGDLLSWARFAGQWAGSVQLNTPGARRLLHYLFSCDQAKVTEAAKSYSTG